MHTHATPAEKEACGGIPDRRHHSRNYLVPCVSATRFEHFTEVTGHPHWALEHIFQTDTAAVYPVREKQDTSSAPHRTTDTTSDNLTKVHTGYSETRQSKGHRVNVDTC